MNTLLRHCLPLMLACAAAPAAAQGPPPPALSGELADRLAIEQLVVEYAYLLDHGRANELAALFTSDGVLETLGERAHGRPAIAAFYAKRAADSRTTRHITTNLRLVFEAPDRASGTRLILYFRGDGDGPPFPASPGSVGEYSETFRREADGRWRFASRTNTLLFAGKKRD